VENEMACQTSKNRNLSIYRAYERGVQPQGLAVIFSHHQVCIKKKKGGHLLGGQK
jgi:hypothetical protein